VLGGFEKKDATQFRETLAVHRGWLRSAIIARFHRLALNNEVTLKNEDLFYPSVAMRGKMGTRLHSHYRSDRFLPIINKEDFLLAAWCINGSPRHSFRSGNEQSVVIEKDLSRDLWAACGFIDDCGTRPLSRLLNGRRFTRYKCPAIERCVESQREVSYQALFEDKSLHTNSESFFDEIFILMNGKNDRGSLNTPVPKEANCLDAGELGHRDVGHNKIRRKFKHAFDKCSTIPTFGDNREVGRESLGDCVDHFRQVVREDDAYLSTRALHRVCGAQWKTKDPIEGP
jgi:hypothetical protein